MAAKKKRWGKVLLALMCAGVVFVMALVGAVVWRTHARRTPEPSDCLIVLGARVWPDGRLSDTLRYRCESALEAYRQGLAINIIVSGAQGSDEPCAEAEAMRLWFVDKGVPEDCIFLEDASRDTWQNLENSREIMRRQGWTSAIVVTSDYHLERSLWIARDLGVCASGIATQSPKPFAVKWKNRLREAGSWGVYALRKLF